MKLILVMAICFVSIIAQAQNYSELIGKIYTD